jgi:hypothetical protein
MAQKGFDELGIVRPLFLRVLLCECAFWKGLYIPLPIENLAALIY